MSSAQAHGNTKWTQARVDELRGLWGSGKSASQIAAIFGGGCTRNMVISKVHRLGMTRQIASKPKCDKRGQLSGKAVGKIRAARDAAKPPKPVPLARMSWGEKSSPIPVAPTPYVETIEEAGLVTLCELQSHHCRWPIGDPSADAFRYCGKDQQAGSGYCPGHHRRAYVATLPRRPKTEPRDNRRRAA